MAITAALVKELRERTGAGMMECKKFLQENGGDIEQSIDAMRKAGAAKAAKREGRITAEGLIYVLVSSDGKSGVIVEVNSETDFVARSDEFIGFTQMVAQRALQAGTGDLEKVMQLGVDEGAEKSIDTRRQELVGKLGENIKVRRIDYIVSEVSVGCYTHGDRIGVLIEVKGGAPDLAKDLAMHIAASHPVVVNQSDVSQDLIEREKEIYSAQARESGKPEEIIEKMIAGRMNKYLDEVSLMGQSFIKDPNTKISALLEKEHAQVSSFVRYEVGEGIEKKVEDFAQEVLSQVRGSES